MYSSWKSCQVNFTECDLHWQDCTVPSYAIHQFCSKVSEWIFFFKSGECAHWTSMWHFYWYRNATVQILHSYCATPIDSFILSMSQLCNSVHKVVSKEFGKKKKKMKKWCHCEIQATWNPHLFILSWKYTWLLFHWLHSVSFHSDQVIWLKEETGRSKGGQVLTRDSVLDISSAVQCTHTASHCQTGRHALMCFVLFWNSIPAPSCT